MCVGFLHIKGPKAQIGNAGICAAGLDKVRKVASVPVS